MSTLLYLKNLIKDRNIGSVTPTNLYTVKKFCDLIDFKRTKAVVEYGPGGGVFSKYLLDNLSQDAKLIAIDTNKNFVEYLNKTIEDPRFFCYNMSAENILDAIKSSGLEEVDYVISGIPFSFFDENLKRRIIANTNKALAEHGSFLIYQFRKQPDLIKVLREEMQEPLLGKLMFNIPPLYTYQSKKKVSLNAELNGHRSS